MKKIKVGAVNYLNTKPLLYGIKHHPIIEQIELVEDYPANVAKWLIDGRIDIGLVPVAALLRLPISHIVGDYCIGCDGEVASVCLFSQVPMREIQTVYLDYQSRTSVNLAKILLSEHWQHPVKFIDATGEDFRDEIVGPTAGVVIGDRAFEQRKRSNYIYDLGAGWKDFTGLPFVFAAWVSNTNLSLNFQQQFNKANAFGLSKLTEVVGMNSSPFYDLDTYYKTNISYHLDEEKKAGMALYLSKLKTLSD